MKQRTTNHPRAKRIGYEITPIDSGLVRLFVDPEGHGDREFFERWDRLLQHVAMTVSLAYGGDRSAMIMGLEGPEDLIRRIAERYVAELQAVDTKWVRLYEKGVYRGHDGEIIQPERSWAADVDLGPALLAHEDTP